MAVYLFPGQGAQTCGMGAGLFERFPEQVEMASDIVGYSIKELCLHDADGRLDNTRYTQPALFTVNALHYLALRDAQPEPHYLIGHSLGEYNALHAADVFDFPTGVELTQLRGKLMSEARDGGMAAVLGISQAEVSDVLADAGLDQVHVANLNAPAQTVVSGEKNQLRRAIDVFSNIGAACVELNVSGAFHSPLMAPAREEFDTYLSKVVFHEPSIPVIANVSARPYAPDGIRAGLAQQLTSPVLWTQSVRYVLDANQTEFVEVGPRRVLTQLVSRIVRDS